MNTSAPAAPRPAVVLVKITSLPQLAQWFRTGNPS